jgi:hypothetical protein
MRRATARAPDIKLCSSIFDRGINMTIFADPELNPGDEAKPGTPGSAEDICDVCSGSGKLADGAECATCGGSGRVIRGVGGG